MRLKKTKSTSEEELMSLLNEGYKMLKWIDDDYKQKNILQNFDAEKDNLIYTTFLDDWGNKVISSLNAIFPMEVEAHSFIYYSPPGMRTVNAEQDYKYASLRLRFKDLLFALKELIDHDLGKYTDLPLKSRLYIEDIDSFRGVKDINPDMVVSYLKNGYLDVSEELVQVAIEQILNEPFHKKDWGGETNDLYTSNVLIQGRRIATAFLLKGNGLKKPKMEIRDCGANGDQVVRLCQSPALLFIIQFVGEVAEGVIKHLEHEIDLLRYNSKEAWYCIMKGQDTARLLYAYGKLPSQQKNDEVYSVICKFYGQRVPGKIFGLERDIKLAKFERVEKDVEVSAEENENDVSIRLDVYALNDDSSGLRWIIKTELFPPAPEVVYQLARFGQILNAKCWLVIFDQIPSETLALAKNLKVMISGIEEWRQLKELFGLTSNLATK